MHSIICCLCLIIGVITPYLPLLRTELMWSSHPGSSPSPFTLEPCWRRSISSGIKLGVVYIQDVKAGQGVFMRHSKRKLQVRLLQTSEFLKHFDSSAARWAQLCSSLDHHRLSRTFLFWTRNYTDLLVWLLHIQTGNTLDIPLKSWWLSRRKHALWLPLGQSPLFLEFLGHWFKSYWNKVLPMSDLAGCSPTKSCPD